MEFNFKEFLKDGYTSQQKYSELSGIKGPLDYMELEERYPKIIEMLGHLIEETIEVREYVPRKTWKKNEKSYLDSDQNRVEYIKEYFDILLFFRAALAYSGISPEEFVKYGMEKMNYNKVRKDHIN